MIINPYRYAAGGASDSDATAFLTATGITDPTISSKITNLVIALKTASIWTKFHAIWPMVGGADSTCKYNLKDPRDADNAFRLTYTGGITFSANGAQPNGSDGIAYTYYIPATYATLNDAHLSYYSRTNDSTNGGGDISRASSGDGSNFRLYIDHNTLGTIVDIHSVGTRIMPGGHPTTTQRLWVASRVSSTDLKLYQDGTQIASNTSTETGSLSSARAIVLFGDGNEALEYSWGNKECAFASIGTGLTPTNVTDLTNAVNTFQTGLGRNV